MGISTTIKSLIIIPLTIFSYLSCKEKQDTPLTPKEQLGKLIFFDETLSEPAGQSCATCHTPEKGFADKFARPISEGAVKNLYSSRNSMTIAYSAFIPELYYNEEEETYIGGLFWDGRSHSLEDQAKQPFINPVEMGNSTTEMVVNKIKQAPYFKELTRIYGTSDDPDTLYHYISDALAAYQRSSEVNPFSSKFDAYLAGKCPFTEEELKGMDLFKNKGLCAECHIMDNDPQAGKVLFTDHTYDNLGIPQNPESKFYTLPAQYNPHGQDSIDLGLGSIMQDSLHFGKFRVPTLRNIALTAPYSHNGYFKTLEEIVHFYNIRDVSDKFPAPEHLNTMNTEELGNLQLTPEEEALIVAFLKTLTDGYKEPVK